LGRHGDAASVANAVDRRLWWHTVGKELRHSQAGERRLKDAAVIRLR
jgi:hypothetical protein